MDPEVTTEMIEAARAVLEREGILASNASKYMSTLFDDAIRAALSDALKAMVRHYTIHRR